MCPSPNIFDLQAPPPSAFGRIPDLCQEFLLLAGPDGCVSGAERVNLSRLSPQDEKEQLNEHKGHLSGLAKRAKAIVQLKPRNPAYPVRGHVHLLAVCDYKQVEVRRPGSA